MCTKSMTILDMNMSFLQFSSLIDLETFSAERIPWIIQFNSEFYIERLKLLQNNS